jgi:hypothetical protein
MIPASHAETLQILRDNPQGLKTRDILKKADDIKDSQIADLKNASAMIYTLRASKYVTSSVSGGQNIHQITKKGIEALEAFYADQQASTVQPTKNYSLSSLGLDSGQESCIEETDEKLAERQLDITLDMDTQPQPMEQPETLETAQNQPLQSDEIPQPAVSYDPFKDIYNGLQKAAEMVEKLPRPKPAFVVKQPKEKIMMLRYAQEHYDLINADVGNLFADMINDYQQLEQGA